VTVVNSDVRTFIVMRRILDLIRIHSHTVIFRLARGVAPEHADLSIWRKTGSVRQRISIRNANI